MGSEREFYGEAWLAWSGRTQADVAAAIGMTQSHISEILSGRVRYNEGFIPRFAKELGIRPWLLFYGPPSAGLRAVNVLNQLDQIDSTALELATRALRDYSTVGDGLADGNATPAPRRRGRPRRSA